MNLKQTPDRIKYQDQRYDYDANGYPFLIDPYGKIYIGAYSESHIQLLQRIQQVERRKLPKSYNMKAGRFFEVGLKQYVMTLWMDPKLSQLELQDVVRQFKKVIKGVQKIYFEIYSPHDPTSFIFIPLEDLPTNQHDWYSPQSYHKYIQKKKKSMAYSSSKKDTRYDDFKYKNKDMIKNPELYFGKLKQKLINRIIRRLRETE